jgi:hypothetical protein
LELIENGRLDETMLNNRLQDFLKRNKVGDCNSTDIRLLILLF